VNVIVAFVDGGLLPVFLSISSSQKADFMPPRIAVISVAFAFVIASNRFVLAQTKERAERRDTSGRRLGGPDEPPAIRKPCRLLRSQRHTVRRLRDQRGNRLRL
jgi:hypothetical protein